MPSQDRSDAYVVAARTAVELVSRPQVAAAWSAPSVLPEWAVGGLAAHLLGQVFSVTSTLANSSPGAAPVSLLEHYQQVRWRGAPLDEPANVAIRSAGEEQAQVGRERLLEQSHAELDALAARLPTLPGGQVVSPPWLQWALTLDDFLITRLMEISVHSDDLAVSVGVDTPALPTDVTQPVRHLLVDLAAERHGDLAVLRALSRADRAPASIAAI